MSASGDPLQQIEAYSSLLGVPVKLTDKEVESYWEENVLKGPNLPDTFVTLLDYRQPGFTHVHGVEKVLGVSSELTLTSYLNRVHPAMVQLYALWAQEALEMAIQHKKELEPFKYTYRVSFPILHGNGNYYSVIQNSTVLQVDENQQLVSQLNTYRMGIAFHEVDIQNLKGEIFSAEDSSQRWNEVFMENISKKIMDTFTKKEREILHSYAEGDHTPAALAKHHHITLQTLYTHNKHILRKTQELFFRGFGSVIEVADYLKNSGYLPK